MKNNNQLPKFHETFLPILDVLNSEGTIHYTTLRKKVRDKFYSDLPQELLSKKISTGDYVLLNRIGWAKSYLKQGKFLTYPERAMVKITEKGRKKLESGTFTLQDLKKDPDYIAYAKKRDLNKKDRVVEADTENSSPQDLIDTGFAAIKTEVEGELLERLKVIDPYYFEKVILLLLEKMGYGDLIETSKSGDHGIDGVINQDKLGLEKIYIQAKRYNENKVREKDIRNFIGAMSGDTTKGVFVTTSTFDKAAIKKSQEAHHTIILIDGNKLVELMHTYGVGVQVKSTYHIKVIDEDFFEGS